MTRIYPFQRTARWLSLGFLAAALLLGGWASSWAQEEKPGEKKEDPKQMDPSRTIVNEDGEVVEIQPLENANIRLRGTQKKKRQQEKALSPHHEMLHKLVGHWTTQMRVHVPGEEPVQTEGMVDSELVLGGRALETRFMGMFMGSKHSGLGLDGYDMNQGKHFSFWMDTTNTGATYSSGDCDHDGQDVVTLVGEFTDPQSGENVRRKTVLTLLSTSRYTYEEWHTRAGGEPTLAMQIIFSKSEQAAKR